MNIQPNFKFGEQVGHRNEPANIIRVAECISTLMGIDVSTLTEQVYANTRKCLNISKEIQTREDKEDVEF